MFKSAKSFFQKQAPVITPDAAHVSTESTEASHKGSWLQNVLGVFAHNEQAVLTEDDYEALEDQLIKADLGVDLALSLVETLRQQKATTPAALREVLIAELAKLLQPIASKTALTLQDTALNILVFTGVNGVGKTTMVGKLAYHFKQQGKRVLVAGADTFRAAAVDQLAVWCERANVPFVSLEKGNASAVVFDAIKQAKETSVEILLIDTAGRLQNKFNLMEELKNLDAIITKEAPEGHTRETILVVDANTGQNAIQQVKLFKDAMPLTGIGLTKIDGSAKGGVVFSIVQQFGLPIKLLGVGEKITDLSFFDAERYTAALLA